jgi:acyl-coenzyme A thioesterase PaaI-like protein
MDITRLPFNEHIGITRATDGIHLLRLTMRDCLKNHLGTVHASALFALAEATSGEFLIRALGDRADVGGVVRRSASKYSSPVKGDVFSRVKTPKSDIESAIQSAEARGKALVSIDVELLAEDPKPVATFGFTWLLAIENPGPK